MSDVATKQDLKDLEKNIDKKIYRAIDDLSEIIRDFADTVDARFNKVEEEIADIRRSIDRLINTCFKLEY